MDEEMEICSNCKREIRSVNYVTHSVHCHRNIVICNKCKEPVPRAELAEHDATEHGFMSCEGCGAQVENSAMTKHKKEICLQRIVTCTFCELELKAIEAIEHENYCGTRTEKCTECGEFVMLKYQTLHVDSNHGFLKLEDEPGPPPSWETPPSKAPSKPTVAALPCRPILKSAIRGPSSSNLPTAPKKSVSNTVRFAPIETPSQPKSEMTPSPKIEKQTEIPVVAPKDNPPVLPKVAVTSAVPKPTPKVAVAPVVPRNASPILPKATVTPAVAPKNVPPSSPKVEKEERQIKFANNKIGAEVKPIINTAASSVSYDYEPKRHPLKATLSIEESDRLLAFKLAQEEMEMMSKIQLDGILQHRRKVTDADKSMKIEGEEKGTATKTPEKFMKFKGEEKETAAKNPDPQESVAFMPEKSKSKSPTPKPEIPNFQPREFNNIEDVQIPCEFCEVLVPASRLLIHQTGCRPDITSYIPFKHQKPNQAALLDPENTYDQAAAVTKTQTKNLIPCDLCNANIPAEKFIQHQLACEIKHLPGRSEKPKALVMPLSGRTLKASKSIDESILPALETLEREALDTKGRSLRNCNSANDLIHMSGPSRVATEETPEEKEKKTKQGAVPKLKPSIKKYRAPQPPQNDKPKGN